MKLAWGAKVDAAFRARVLHMAARLSADPSHLMAVMYFESRLNPAAVNTTSGATGLIQFMPSTARDLNTTVEALRAMTALAQLDYVERYFQRYAGRLGTLNDVYTAVLWPVAIGKPDDYILFASPQAAYNQNRALDVDNNGAVTKAEACSFVARCLAEGLQPGNVFETDARTDTPQPAGPTTTQPTQREDKRMAPLAALQIFGPILAGLIPQIASILKPESEVAKRNVGLAETLVKTITETAKATNLEDAVGKMQADASVKEAVQKAVVTEPTVMSTLQITEVGGGIAGARQADIATQQQEKPFWKASAVFWMSVLLLPMAYWLVGSLIVGGVRLPAEAPWWAQTFVALFGDEWTGEARSGGFNLVIGLILGGICGVYYGVSVTQQKTQQAATTGSKDSA